MKAIQFLLTLFLCLSPSLVFGGTAYYVDCSATKNGNGSSSSPWNNIASVNTNSFSPGDDVYFRSGTTCVATENLEIDWTGSSDLDRVIIGCYDGQNDFTCDGQRPVIDGNNWTVPNNDYEGLIHIYGETIDYITVKDLYIKHSKEWGIYVNRPDHIKINNCYIYRSKKSGIALLRSTDGLITNNTVEESTYLTRPGPGILLSAMSEIGSTTNCIVKNNIVFHTNEGIGVYKGVNNSTVEYNVVYDCKSYMIYVENSSYITIRYNLVYSSSDFSTYRTVPHPPAAIIIDSEQAICDKAPGQYPYIGYSQIYGNLIASTGSGIALADECDKAVHKNNKIYNNTIVDCRNNFRFGNNNPGWSGNEIKNNISWTISSDSNHVYQNNYSKEGIEWDNNNFDDPVFGNASTNAKTYIPQLKKISGWRSLKPGTVDGREWSLLENSKNRDNAIPIDGYNARIYHADFTAEPVQVNIKLDYIPAIGAWTGSPDDLLTLNPPNNLSITY